MQVVDLDKSEHGLQRITLGGRALHCCCICGELGVWGQKWSTFCSEREIDESLPIPKFCSEKCRKTGGPQARLVTKEMKQAAKDREYREPKLAYREATEKEKYNAALTAQSSRR